MSRELLREQRKRSRTITLCSFMIQAVTIHARDVVKACKSHDLMRDVANQMLKEERFGSILEEVNKTIQERQRKLVIYEDVDSIPSDISKLNVRSHLMFRVNELSFSALQKLLRQLKLVRVLDLQHAPLEKLPNEIWQFDASPVFRFTRDFDKRSSKISEEFEESPDIGCEKHRS